MERFTPLYAILNSMENLRFDNESYFHVLDFYALFYKRNIFSVFTYVIKTRVEVLENSKWRGNRTHPAGSCSHFNSVLFSQTSTRVSITVWKDGKCFLFLLFKRRIFSVKSVQNLRTFWRTTQNLLSLALFSLFSKQTFKVHLGVEKHIER